MENIVHPLMYSSCLILPEHAQILGKTISSPQKKNNVSKQKTPDMNRAPRFSHTSLSSPTYSRIFCSSSTMAVDHHSRFHCYVQSRNDPATSSQGHNLESPAKRCKAAFFLGAKKLYVSLYSNLL